MDGFDDAGVFFSDNFSESQSLDGTSNIAVKKQLKTFLRDFNQGGNFAFKYRDALKNNYLRFEPDFFRLQFRTLCYRTSKFLIFSPFFTNLLCLRLR